MKLKNRKYTKIRLQTIVANVTQAVIMAHKYKAYLNTFSEPFSEPLKIQVNYYERLPDGEIGVKRYILCVNERNRISMAPEQIGADGRNAK